MQKEKVKERGIVMTTESIRAILDGRKTQTRRVVKPQPSEEWADGINELREKVPIEIIPSGIKPYCMVGDRLWVRETWNCFVFSRDAELYWPTGFIPKEDPRDSEHRHYEVDYRATSKGDGPWRSPYHMPRWASRITLEVIDVRVERVQEICELECYAEGIQLSPNPYENFEVEIVREAYHNLWDSINAKRGHSWESNPWEWAISFKVLEGGRHAASV